MNISERFIRRPIATSLVMMGLLVFGAASYTLLPVAALPDVDFPTITVSASLPGASPDTMATSWRRHSSSNSPPSPAWWR